MASFKKLAEIISQGDLSADYIKERKIAEGGFGSVFKGRKLDSGLDVAIKVLTSPITSESMDLEALQDVINEISHLKRIQHENVITYIDSFLVETKLWIVTEYIHGYTVSEIAHFQRHLLKPEYIAAVCQGTLKALTLIHYMNIIHTDIKVENIMVSKDGVVKVIDLGLSRCNDGTHSRCAGTPPYMAPEMVRSLAYDRAVDIWSLGICVITMLTGAEPYLSKTNDEACAWIKELCKPPMAPVNNCGNDLLKNFVDCCLEEVPHRRGIADDDWLNHPFIRTAASQPQMRNLISIAGPKIDVIDLTVE